jgi:hypothetical protein
MHEPLRRRSTAAKGSSPTCQRTRAVPKGPPARFSSMSVNVRFGSLADIAPLSRHVRFTPDSGHSSVRMGCPKGANRRHPPCRENPNARAPKPSSIASERTRAYSAADLKLPVDPSGKSVHRSAVGVVGRVGDELIVEAEAGRRRSRVAVIGLEDFFEPRMR